MERGAGVPAVDRLAYLAEQATAQLAGTRRWCWPGPARRCRSSPTPACRATWCRTAARSSELAGAGQDVEAALEDLAAKVAAGTEPVLAGAPAPAPGAGPLGVTSLAATIARSLPENAIVVDEANTSGPPCRARWPGRPGTACSR